MGISHLGFCVPQRKFDETVSFYLTTLAPLGYKEMMRPVENAVGLGIYYPDFWITGVPDEEWSDNQDGSMRLDEKKPIHIAFSANSKSNEILY